MAFELGDIISIPLYIGVTAVFALIIFDLTAVINNIDGVVSNLTATLSKRLTLLNSLTILIVGVIWSFGKVYEVVGMIRRYFNPSTEVKN